MQNITFTIERITRENYHMYYDMVSWRMRGVELTTEEKKANKTSKFIDVYIELEHPGFYAYGALFDGRFVGWISIIYIPKIGRQRWEKGVIYIDELWVAPEFRGKGIAKQLIKKAFDYQEEVGAVEVRLYVGEDNFIAQELYEKSGLQMIGKAIYMKSGE